MNEIVLKTNKLVKEYSDRRAVNNLSMTLNRGEIYGFIGQNGAGKTTLLRLVTALIQPTSGSIELFGSSEKNELISARKRIGSMIETPAFFPKLTARENLEYYRIQRGSSEEQEIERVLQQVNLSDTGDKPFHQFSLGMKQRLGLALAIMGEPELLILDELINGLDPTGMIVFRDIIHGLNQEHGITILLSSHILSELTQVATHYGVIHHGQLLKEFTSKELEKNTQGHLSMRVDNADKSRIILQSMIKKDRFEVYPKNEIRLFDYMNDLPAVLEQLSKNGIKIYSTNEVKINLEDYFIQIIEGRD